MTDITQIPAEGLSEDHIFAQGLKTFQSAIRERDSACARADHSEREASLLRSENESLRQSLLQREAERDYYMRFASELTTHITMGKELFELALTKARQGAFRPNGSALTTDKLDSETPPIPTFLTRGPEAANERNPSPVPETPQ